MATNLPNILTFATVAERDAYWPAATAPAMAMCEVGSDGSIWQVFGGAWRLVYAPAAYFAVTHTDPGSIAQSTTITLSGTFTIPAASYVRHAVITSMVTVNCPTGAGGRNQTLLYSANGGASTGWQIDTLPTLSGGLTDMLVYPTNLLVNTSYAINVSIANTPASGAITLTGPTDSRYNRLAAVVYPA